MEFSASCGVSTQCGPIVQAKEILQAAPGPTGGAIAAGTYFLTSLNIYRGMSGGPTPTEQQTVTLTTSAFTDNSYVNGHQQSPLSATYLSSGTMVTLTLTCPTSGQRVLGFTAAATTLTLYETIGSDVYELVETKQ
jgi:hypothetical protein